MRRRGPDGVQADVSLRGADYNGTLVLVDGEPVNDPQTNHHTLDLDVPADAIERVEVLYGAASALYGSEAIGGVINVVTRGGSLGKARAQLEGRYVHGSHSLDAGSLRLATKVTDAVTVSVDGSRSESSGFRDDREHAIGAFRASVRVDTAVGPVTLAGGTADRAFGAYAFYGTRYPNQQESTRTRSLRLSADLAVGGGWSLAPSASVRNHRDDFVLERTDPDFYRNLHETDRTAFRLVARRPLLGGTLAVGGEAGRDTIDSTNLGDHARSRTRRLRRAGAAVLDGLPFRRRISRRRARRRPRRLRDARLAAARGLGRPRGRRPGPRLRRHGLPGPDVHRALLRRPADDREPGPPPREGDERRGRADVGRRAR